jgi:signal transduction histidine kinase
MDITERKRAEETLQQLQAELAHVTRTTTMGELAASIAHEINQPLGAIVNNGNACLRLLGEAPAQDDVRQALADIVDDANRASAVIARIRALTKQSIPEKAALNFRDVIADVLTLARRELAERRITVHTELVDDLPRVSGDRIQLQQVLLNLVRNGIEAMSAMEDKRRVMVLRGQRSELDGKPALLLTVQDFGDGFPEEDADRLFEAFYTTKPHGTGLGLRISRSIMEAHGGHLWATSQPGIGATFSLNLPI